MVARGLDPATAACKAVAMFVLAPAFLAGSEPLASLGLCEARFQIDARFPWLILIPRVARASEIEDLGIGDHARLIEEIVLAGRAVRAMGESIGRPVAKLNVAALGNITPQLHVHIVGRRPDDAAWPGPVWGTGAPIAYSEEDAIGVRAAAFGVLSGA